MAAKVKRRLGQLLMEHGLVTQQQLDQALTAQQVYGGRLGTILVEHGHVHEDDLARVLSEQSGMQVIARDTLQEIDPRVIALVPRSVAERYHVVPFRFEIDPVRIFLATMDPADLRFTDELEFVLGRRVELRLCPEIVLNHALEKHYGFKREKRFIRLERGEARAGRRLGATPAAAAPAAAPSGSDVLARLVAATDIETVLTVALDALERHGRKVAFFALHGKALAGWSGRGLTCAPEVLARVHLDVGASDTVRRVLLQRHGETVSPSAADPQLADVLARQLLIAPADGDVLLLPLEVGDRLLGLFAVVGQRTDKPPDPAVLAELVRRVGVRAHAIHLTAGIAAPLPGL